MSKPKLNILQGTELAVIKGKGSLDGVCVRFSNKKIPGMKRFKYLKLDSEKYKFEPCPTSDIDIHNKPQRDILYITGPSGSGKSTYVKMFLKNYKKKFPENNIYLFSKLQDDDSLDDPELDIKRAIIGLNLLEDPLDVSHFENSIVIYDDVDDIPEISKQQKEIKKALLQLRAEILSTGRHHNVTMLNTIHEACNSLKTKQMLNESHMVTFFPHSGQSGLSYFCDKYLDINQKMLHKIKNLDTRWVTVSKRYPTCVFTEHEIFPKAELEYMLVNEMESSDDEEIKKEMIGNGYSTHLKIPKIPFYSNTDKVTCEICGAKINKKYFAKHETSKRHRDALEEQERCNAYNETCEELNIEPDEVEEEITSYANPNNNTLNLAGTGMNSRVDYEDVD